MNEQDGWTRPLPADSPRPTYWPAALALGLTVTLWGMVTTPVILGVGAAVGVTALVGWVRELIRMPPAKDTTTQDNGTETIDVR